MLALHPVPRSEVLLEDERLDPRILHSVMKIIVSLMYWSTIGLWLAEKGKISTAPENKHNIQKMVLYTRSVIPNNL